MDVGAEGDEPRGRPHLDARLDELVGKALAVMLAAHEDVEVLLLQLQGDFCRRLFVRGRAHDSGEARCRAVDELDAPLPEDEVGRGAEPNLAVHGVFSVDVAVGIVDKK